MAPSMHIPYIEAARFYPQVPTLFWENQRTEMDAYNKVIYNLDERATSAAVARILDFQGAKADPTATAAALNRVLDSLTYPSAGNLLELKGLGVDLPTAVALVHFYRPAWPLYRKEAVKSLGGMGFTVEFDTNLTEEGIGHYEGYMAAIDFLKHRIPYPFVPETNVFLSRLIESALTRMAKA